MKIYKTKNGQPYIKLKNGRAKFISRKKAGIKKSYSFRKSKASSTSLTKKRKTRYNTMAKRKRTTRRSSSSILGNLNKPLMGAGGVVLYESIISPMIPLQGTAKDLLELVGGLYLSKKKGFLGATGKSLVVLNSYQLISGLVGNKLSGLINSNQTSMYDYE